MFKLIFASIAGGGPWEWAALALGTILLFGGTFAAGAEWQSQRDVKVTSNAAPAAATAQHAADVKQHETAVAANTIIVAHDAVADRALAAILVQLAALHSAPDCGLTTEQIDLLNKAGKVQQ